MSQVLIVGGCDFGFYDKTVIALRELQPNNKYKMVFIEEWCTADQFRESFPDEFYLTAQPELPDIQIEVVKPKQNRGPERSRNARKVW